MGRIDQQDDIEAAIRDSTGIENIVDKRKQSHLHARHGSYDTFTSEKRSIRNLIRQRRQRHVATTLDTKQWMSRLSDHIPISALTIPGTHDSAAHNSQWPFVKTQHMTIAQQLDAGIRYFDLRCGLTNDELQMVHGRVGLETTFAAVLENMYEFLTANPSEALLAQIKRDRPDQDSNVSFSQAVFAAIEENKSRWRLESTTPRVGELRGKIQLLRRFKIKKSKPTSAMIEKHKACDFAKDDAKKDNDDDTDNDDDDNDNDRDKHGINLSHWPENPNTPAHIHTKHSLFTIQDHFKPDLPTAFPDLIATKGNDIATLLKQAASDSCDGNWYLNFTSAFEINFLYQFTPVQIALGSRWQFTWVDGINTRLSAWLDQNSLHPGSHDGLQRMSDHDVLEQTSSRPPLGLGGEGRSCRHTRYGVLLMDFPDHEPATELIGKIIMCNHLRHPKRTTRIPSILVFGFLCFVFGAGVLLRIVHGPGQRKWCTPLLLCA